MCWSFYFKTQILFFSPFLSYLNSFTLSRQRSHKKQIKNKSKGDGRNKNRIKLIVTSKKFPKTF